MLKLHEITHNAKLNKSLTKINILHQFNCMCTTKSIQKFISIRL